jgi:large subunit ribosomal protein L29
MKGDEIRGLADDELKVRINELEEERFRLRFRSGTEQLEEPLRLRSIRRDIARLQTIARERALGIVRGTSASPSAKGSTKGTKGSATKAAAKKATKARGR